MSISGTIHFFFFLRQGNLGLEFTEAVWPLSPRDPPVAPS